MTCYPQETKQNNAYRFSISKHQTLRNEKDGTNENSLERFKDKGEDIFLMMQQRQRETKRYEKWEGRMRYKEKTRG